MSSVRTILENTKPEAQSEVDGKQLSSSQKNEKTKVSVNMNTIIPKKLNNNEVSSYFEHFLQDLEDEDIEACIANLKKEKISGRTLVLACENSNVMEELIKKLDFPLDFKLRFDDMIKHVRQREKELKNLTKDSNESEQAAEMPVFDSMNAPQANMQTITNSECVIGVVHNTGRNQQINHDCHYYEEDYKIST